MRRSARLTAVFALVVGIVLTLGANPGAAQPQPQVRAHAYLLRGLMNIFSLGMDTLAEQLKRRGVYATVHNYAEWQTLAEGVPVALVVPFDGTQSFAASDNVARVLNLTQRNYAYMRRGPGFKGTLDNVNVSSDHSIDHINIDKSPRLHARVVAEVLAVVGNHRVAAPGGPKPSSGAPAPAGQDTGAVTAPAGKLEGVPSAAPPQAAPAKNGTQPLPAGQVPN
jgi:hypothetical protein